LKKSVNIKELTYISLGVAILIAGGFAILQLSMIFPIPGTKYILMAPYISMVFMVIQTKLGKQLILLKIGLTFGAIMSIFNLYMGITILLTSVLTQVTMLFLPVRKRAFWGSSLFSLYMGLSALTVSKHLLGGIFLGISGLWILAIAFICLIFGLAGAMYARRIMTYLNTHITEN